MNLARFARRRYADGPTPLQPLARLSQVLGGPNLFIKRDDLLGFGLRHVARVDPSHAGAFGVDGEHDLVGGLSQEKPPSTGLPAWRNRRLFQLWDSPGWLHRRACFRDAFL